jgi:hypothetical protein
LQFNYIKKALGIQGFWRFFDKIKKPYRLVGMVRGILFLVGISDTFPLLLDWCPYN